MFVYLVMGVIIVVFDVVGCGQRPNIVHICTTIIILLTDVAMHDLQRKLLPLTNFRQFFKLAGQLLGAPVKHICTLTVMFCICDRV